jgi:hypothetical protein
MRTIVASLLSLGLISSAIAQSVHDAQDAITCEAWADAAGQQSKLVTQLRDWILHEMRKTAHDLARRDYPHASDTPIAPCEDLSCLNDEKLLKSLDDWCFKKPAVRLTDAIFDSTIVLVMLQQAAEQDRRNAEEDRQNSK